jgi:hypothetical protein
VSLKPYIYQILIVLLSSSLLACASSGDKYESAGDPVDQRGRDCIWQSSIRDYQVLDDKNLLVSAGGKRRYHVELTRRAYGLRSNWKIGFRSPTGQLCSGSGKVIVEDGFDRLESIQISSIRLVNPDEIDDLLIRFGKKVPEEQEAPAKKEIKGAEVEELD